jgi:hypothetical protein
MLRWLSDPSLDIKRTQAVTIGHGRQEPELATGFIPSWLSPLQRMPSPPPTTQMLPAKVIHHQAITKFQDVLRHVHTEAELQSLTHDIDMLM